MGHRVRNSDLNAGKVDLLAAALERVVPDGGEVRARGRLRTMTNAGKTVFRCGLDPVASRIGSDFRAICRHESRLPRLAWIRVLMTYLRLALPVWMLSQMRLTTLVHDWAIAALDGGSIPDEATVMSAIASRGRSLLRPTLAPTRELQEHIERYMRHRVELDMLLFRIGVIDSARFAGRKLTTCDRGDKGLPIVDFLCAIRDCGDALRSSERYRELAGGLDTARFLAREGEAFSAWRDPLNAGQGKNIDEFLRVLYRAKNGDEAGGYLLEAMGRGDRRGFRVLPGQEMLKVVAFLAAQENRARASRGGIATGHLALADLEGHFHEYGINFGEAAEARPAVMAELKSMGMLVGSPDAGRSAAVACPY
jgi:hypothetical protein